jgi:hypothetical protein
VNRPGPAERQSLRLARALETDRVGLWDASVVGNDFEIPQKPLHLGFDRARLGDVRKRQLVIQGGVDLRSTGNDALQWRCRRV